MCLWMKRRNLWLHPTKSVFNSKNYYLQLHAGTGRIGNMFSGAASTFRFGQRGDQSDFMAVIRFRKGFRGMMR